LDPLQIVFVGGVETETVEGTDGKGNDCPNDEDWTDGRGEEYEEGRNDLPYL
jgi:hypothetical protein